MMDDDYIDGFFLFRSCHPFDWPSSHAQNSRFIVRSALLKSQVAMFCSISGQIPQEPVFALSTGHVYEKRLIEKALEASSGNAL